MLPDGDPRHGTPNGYKNGPCRCLDCADAYRRYNKTRGYLAATGRALRVDSLGTQRRVRSLMAMGHGLPTLAADLGIATGNLSYKMQQPYVARSTHERVVEMYDRLSAEPEPEGWVCQRTRNIAAKRGWPLPSAWLNIDDPAEKPDPGYTEKRSHGDHDPVVVDRILSGDASLAPTATKAERIEVVARWRSSGRPLNELERLTSWEPRRYVRKDVA